MTDRAKILQNTKGVDKDEEAAFNCFSIAAASGDPNSLLPLQALAVHPDRLRSLAFPRPHLGKSRKYCVAPPYTLLAPGGRERWGSAGREAFFWAPVS